MKKIFFQVFTGIFLGLIILMIGFVGYFYLNQDKIVDVLINEINRKVDTKIDVGEVSMSFWERFPSISVKFQDVVVHSSVEYSGTEADTLLFAQHLFFDLNVRTLVSQTPKISRLSVVNGFITLATDRHGRNNYDIFPPEPSATKKAQKDFQIDAFELENVQVNYKDDRSNDFYQNEIISANIEGMLNANTFNLNVQLKLAKTNLIPTRYNYFSTYSWNGNISRSANGFFQWNGELRAENFSAEVQGSYNLPDETMVVKSGEIKIQTSTINKFLRKEKINQFKLIGGALFIKSFDYFAGKNTWQIHAVFKGNPDIEYLKKRVSLKMDGQLTNDGKNTLINFDRFDALHANSNLHFEGSFRYPQQYVRGITSFSLNLVDWQSDLEKLPVTNITGIVVGQAQVDGRLAPGTEISSFFKEGEVGLQNVGLDIRDNNFSIRQLNSNMNVTPEKILIKNLNGTFNKNKLAFNGEVSSIFNYLLENQPLKIKGNVKASHFNLNEYLLISEENTPGNPFQLTDNIRLQIVAEITELVQNKFNAKNFSAEINKFGRRIEMPALFMETAQGTVRAEGKLVQQANNEWFVQMNGKLKQVEVSEVFDQFNNFGQSEIKARHIAGKLTAQVRSEFVFTPEFDVRPASIYLWSDILIENGQLNNYETLQKLAGYISVEELKHVQFDKLQNQITIIDQTVKIPFMEIKSSAIDLDLSGTHTFNNAMDYQLSVGLADVLFKKLRQKHKNTFAWEKNNKMMVAVDIKGTDEDYKVSFKEVKRKKIEPEPAENKPGKKKFQIEFDDM